MIAGVVLAAGLARRFGSQKLIAPVGGVPLVRRTVTALLDASLGDVVVVLGSEAESVAAALNGLPLRLVTNRDYASGMSTSVRTGIDALGHSVEAAVIALGDQPGVEAAILDRLVERYRAGGVAIVAPVYRGGVRGNPVLFDRSVFAELRAITGDEGGRSVIARVPGRVALVEFDREMPTDVDRLEDLAREPPP